MTSPGYSIDSPFIDPPGDRLPHGPRSPPLTAFTPSQRSRPARGASPRRRPLRRPCRRQPGATAPCPIVQHHLETVLAPAADADPCAKGVAGWVEGDFRAYLRCGMLVHGFARIRYDDCAAKRLVTFYCRGSGVCPSCNARRMVEVAAHLTDPVLPPLPTRQWVLSVPKGIRPFLQFGPLGVRRGTDCVLWPIGKRTSG